jgi:hypothetical protein
MSSTSRACVAFAFVVVALGCAHAHEASPVATPTTPTARARSAREDCAERPLLEWYARADETLGNPLGLGGHVQAIGVDDVTDPSAVSILGALDVKGTLALERNTHRMARANYTASVRDAGSSVAGFAVVLEGRVIGGMNITTTLRGSRFRVPLTPHDPEHPWPGDGTLQGLRMRLERAIDHDLRCFRGTEPPEVPDS